MAISDLTGKGIAVLGGVEDSVMQWWDENKGRTKPFKNATDLSRVAMALVGLGVEQFAPAKYSRIGDTVAKVGLALTTISVVDGIRSMSAKKVTTTARGSFVPRGRVPTGNMGEPTAPGGYRPISA